MTSTVIIGGSSGIGFELARRAAATGADVVITSRDKGRADAAAGQLGPTARGLAIDLSAPETIADSLADITGVDHLVITAIDPGANTLRDFDIPGAIRSITTKLVGYTEAVRALSGRFNDGAAVVLFGGLAKERPYPGSTMVSTFNAGISGLVRTLAVELAPHRVNAIHPGQVGDSPKLKGVTNHPAIPRTPIGRLVTTAEVADAVEFLLNNTGINAHNLNVDGGWLVG
ncbi:MAG TPA: SDR family oxidoreductase [Pseudonocardiaceae bacterium]|nr:SDR family oxidoreductase [Pseudonocardiaceae bacterium]